MLADRLTQVKLKYSVCIVCIVVTFIHISDVSVCVDCGRFQTGQITWWKWNQQPDHHIADRTWQNLHIMRF